MLNYYVIEIQTHSDGTSGNIVTGYEGKNESEDAFLSAKMAANDSSVHCHTIIWIDKEGKHMEPPKCYHHAEPVPETEQNAPAE